MRLSEIKSFKTKGPSTREFVVKKWDGHEPVQRGGDTEFVEPFDVLVSYEYEDLGYSDHPYGEGHARENHGASVVITSLVANEPVKLIDDETGKLIKDFPKGTKLENIPGWSKGFMEYFQEQAEKDSEND